MEQSVRLAIAEDHELIRKSLIALLKGFKEITVVGEVGNGKALIDLLKSKPVDVVLLDFEMPVMNGPQALKVITQRFPTVKVIMLSMHNDFHSVYEMMMSGARAYLPKNCDVKTLINTITTVKNHGYYFCNHVSKAILNGSMHQASINPLLNEKALSDREIEVLQLLCYGKTNKEIALALFITPRTVDFHRGNLYTKTKSSNIAELIRYSIKNGLVSYA
jgi:DNA-binding NarL/FixJ family response regulator